MSTVTWKDVPTRTVDVGGVEFAYRELGAGSDVPVVFQHHEQFVPAALAFLNGAAEMAS